MSHISESPQTSKYELIVEKDPSAKHPIVYCKGKWVQFFPKLNESVFKQIIEQYISFSIEKRRPSSHIKYSQGSGWTIGNYGIESDAEKGWMLVDRTYGIRCRRMKEKENEIPNPMLKLFTTKG